jgi:hypothetical protein
MGPSHTAGIMVRKRSNTRLNARPRVVLLTGLMVNWGCSSKQNGAPEGTPGEGSVNGGPYYFELEPRWAVVAPS